MESDGQNLNNYIKYKLIRNKSDIKLGFVFVYLQPEEREEASFVTVGVPEAQTRKISDSAGATNWATHFQASHGKEHQVNTLTASSFKDAMEDEYDQLSMSKDQNFSVSSRKDFDINLFKNRTHRKDQKFWFFILWIISFFRMSLGRNMHPP